MPGKSPRGRWALLELTDAKPFDDLLPSYSKSWNVMTHVFPISSYILHFIPTMDNGHDKTCYCLQQKLITLSNCDASVYSTVTVHFKHYLPWTNKTLLSNLLFITQNTEY